MNQQQLEKMIDKMMNIIKPKGVSFMEYKLDPLDIHGDEYYMGIMYVVPDDSELLLSNNRGTSELYRQRWNRAIHNTIKNYFDVDVIINISGVRSETYYQIMKNF